MSVRQNTFLLHNLKNVCWPANHNQITLKIISLWSRFISEVKNSQPIMRYQIKWTKCVLFPVMLTDIEISDTDAEYRIAPTPFQTLSIYMCWPTRSQVTAKDCHMVQWIASAWKGFTGFPLFDLQRYSITSVSPHFCFSSFSCVFPPPVAAAALNQKQRCSQESDLGD